MNCNRFQKLLHEYLDETLSPRARSLIEKHLEGCEHCRNALALERNFAARVSEQLRRRASKVTLRRDIQQNVMAALESEVRLPEILGIGKRAFVRSALAVAATACLVVAAVFIFRKGGSPPGPPSRSGEHRPPSYAMCMATIYADESKTDWVERRLIVEMRNGGEGYLKIIARKPPKPDPTKKEKEEQS